MREPRLYLDLELKCELELTLPTQASHYVSKVLRMRVGQHFWLFNGSGGFYQAEIIAMARRQVDVIVREFEEDKLEPTLHITLAQGISRGQHMDYTLQKAVELGVSKIVPLMTEFGNVRIEEKSAEKKMLHWRKIIIASCEQCGRNRLPALSEPTSLLQWLALDDNSVKLLLHPGAGQRLSTLGNINDPLSVLTGPEGGFSSIEVEQAMASDYVSVNLGPRVLRTETAAVAAISACQALWGDMG
jgi:16S rRNA (uracil1498-N3)-methyltransferase